jgi:hypothetical protein
MDAKGDAPAALAAKQPAKKGMRMRVAELDADGNVVMVDKLIGEGTQGSLDDYRSKDNRVNPDGAGEAVAPTTVLAAASAGDLDTLRALLKDGGDSNQVEFYTTVFRNLAGPHHPPWHLQFSTESASPSFQRCICPGLKPRRTCQPRIGECIDLLSLSTP